LGGDKIKPIKTGSYDDVREDYGQKMPQQFMTIKTPNGIFGQLVKKSRHRIRKYSLVSKLCHPQTSRFRHCLLFSNKGPVFADQPSAAR